jgi:hypothetical protein
MDRGFKYKETEGLLSKSGYEGVSRDINRRIRNEQPRLNKGVENENAGHQQWPDGGVLAGGELCSSVLTNQARYRTILWSKSTGSKSGSSRTHLDGLERQESAENVPRL